MRRMQTAIRPRTRTRDGFTIFELLIVITVMSILAAVALPKVNLHQFRVDAGIRQTQAALMQGARFAVQRQHDVLVSFDVAGGRILTVDDKNNNGVADPDEKLIWRNMEDGVRFANPPRPIGANNSAPVAGGNLKLNANGWPTITFRRDGAASTDLQVYITSTRPDPGDFKALSVTRSTGHVDYYLFRAGNWVRGGA